MKKHLTSCIPTLLMLLAIASSLSSCYEIESYVPDPDKVYVPGERIKPRTERALAADPSMGIALGTLVVLELEHFNSPTSALVMDTDSNGTDAILYSVEDTAILVFRPDVSSDYFIRFYDQNLDSIYFNTYPGAAEVSVRLDPGKYIMKVFSQIPYGVDTIGMQLVFVQPEQEIQAKAGDGLQYWYITSRSMECVKCDLAGLDLSGMYLAGTMLERADLRDARMDGANLRNAFANHADLSGASLRQADLRGISMSFAMMKNADLRDADLRYAILNACDLSGSTLYGANFCFSTKNGWVIDNTLSDTTTQCFP